MTMTPCQTCEAVSERLENGQCRQCRDECTIAALTAEIARLSRLNGRRERQIVRARLQEASVPVTPDWLDSVERIYTEATITQRVCSALRRAWAELAEMDRLREALTTIARPGYGLDPTDTDADAATYWATVAEALRSTARRALAEDARDGT